VRLYWYQRWYQAGDFRSRLQFREFSGNRFAGYVDRRLRVLVLLSRVMLS